MKRSKEILWPDYHNITVSLTADEPGLADSWVKRATTELASALDPIDPRTPDEMYRDAAKAAQRWLNYEMAKRSREGAEVPQVRAFDVNYYAGRSGGGRQIVVIDALSGHVRYQ